MTKFNGYRKIPVNRASIFFEPHLFFNFRDDPPGLLERLDSRGWGVLILLETLLLLLLMCVFRDGL